MSNLTVENINMNVEAPKKVSAFNALPDKDPAEERQGQINGGIKSVMIKEPLSKKEIRAIRNAKIDAIIEVQNSVNAINNTPADKEVNLTGKHPRAVEAFENGELSFLEYNLTTEWLATIVSVPAPYELKVFPMAASIERRQRMDAMDDDSSYVARHGSFIALHNGYNNRISKWYDMGRASTPMDIRLVIQSAYPQESNIITLEKGEIASLYAEVIKVVDTVENNPLSEKRLRSKRNALSTDSRTASDLELNTFDSTVRYGWTGHNLVELSEHDELIGNAVYKIWLKNTEMAGYDSQVDGNAAHITEQLRHIYACQVQSKVIVNQFALVFHSVFGGTGKSLLGEIFTGIGGSGTGLSLMSRDVFINFNAHLAGLVGINIDEVDVSKPEAGETLMNLITQAKITLTKKGVDSFVGLVNAFNIVCSTNKWSNLTGISHSPRRTILMSLDGLEAADLDKDQRLTHSATLTDDELAALKLGGELGEFKFTKNDHNGNDVNLAGVASIITSDDNSGVWLALARKIKTHFVEGLNLDIMDARAVTKGSLDIKNAPMELLGFSSLQKKLNSLLERVKSGVGSKSGVGINHIALSNLGTLSNDKQDGLDTYGLILDGDKWVPVEFTDGESYIVRSNGDYDAAEWLKMVEAQADVSIESTIDVTSTDGATSFVKYVVENGGSVDAVEYSAMYINVKSRFIRELSKRCVSHNLKWTAGTVSAVQKSVYHTENAVKYIDDNKGIVAIDAGKVEAVAKQATDGEQFD